MSRTRWGRRCDHWQIAKSGKWPAVIDTSGQAQTFLRYRDVIYLNALLPRDMEPETLRMGLLGGLRFGKRFAVDFMDVDMLGPVRTAFNNLMPGGWDAVMSNKLVKYEKYRDLIRCTDPPEYQATEYTEERIAEFQVVFLTSAAEPNETLLLSTYPMFVQNAAMFDEAFGGVENPFV